MKKEYINPKVEIVKIAAIQILADSETIPVKNESYGDGSGITLGSREGGCDVFDYDED